MARKSYTPEYKAKLVIQVLRGEKELNEIAAEQGINPNMLRRWQTEFLANASRSRPPCCAGWLPFSDIKKVGSGSKMGH